MENIKIEATERSPDVDFNFTDNTFLLKGESYPEDVSAFFGPIMSAFEEHLGGLNGQSVTFTFDLIYFNSSSAKIIMGLFETLEEAAENGNDVDVIWRFEEDDDNMEELGEEFGEDLETARFTMQEYSQ